MSIRLSMDPTFRAGAHTTIKIAFPLNCIQHTQTHTRTHTHTHTHARTHTRTHAHTHTYMQLRIQ